MNWSDTLQYYKKCPHIHTYGTNAYTQLNPGVYAPSYISNDLYVKSRIKDGKTVYINGDRETMCGGTFG